MPRAILTYKETKPKPKRKIRAPGLFDVIFSSSAIRRIKKCSVHGVVPIAIGTGVVIEGSFAIEIRCIAVMVCATWILVDIGSAISKEKWIQQWKAITFCAFACLCFCAALGCWYWFLYSFLANQQVDAESNLNIAVYSPPNGDIWKSVFTVRNGSRSDIYAKSMTCTAIRIITDKYMAIGDTHLQHAFPERFILKAAGDGYSDSCLDGDLDNAGNIVCGDITLEFQYELVNQPKDVRNHAYRFIINEKGGKVWYQEALESPGSFCK